MESELGRTILIFFISTFTTILLIPLVNKIGLIFNILDIPEKRKQHKKPIVRIGGFAIIISFLVSFILIKNILVLDIETIEDPFNSIFIILISLFFILGLIDDIVHLSAIKRLIIQFLIASLAFFIGINIGTIDLQLFNTNIIINFPVFIKFLITVVWLTGITNAINWLDGLDGLASGITIIIALTISLIAFENNYISISLLSIALAGSNLGFLIFNYYPSKILMGDCGSYFSGFTIASLSLMSTKIVNSSSNIFSFETKFLITFFILALPILDMLKVILQRLSNKKSPFYPDRNHLHYLLIDSGLNHKTSVNMMYIICLFSCSLGLFFHDQKYWSLSLIFSIILILFLIIFTKKIKKLN